jgi:preprotein translocase subunit SecA
MDTLGVEDNMPIESGMVSKQIESAQMKVEGYNFDLRKHLLEYDEVINRQRRVIYEMRTEVLKREDLRTVIWERLEGLVDGMVQSYLAGAHGEDWDMAGLATAAKSLFLPADSEEDTEAWRTWSADQVGGHLLALAKEVYDDKRARLGDELMDRLEREVMLRSIDSWWVKHLTALEELRTGVWVVSFGQQDPLVTFKREGYAMFQSLLANIAEDTIRAVFFAELVSEQGRPSRMLERARAGRGRMIDQAQAATAERPTPVRVGTKLGRNDPCHCGSGKKYKHCHYRIDHGGDGAGTQPAERPAGAKAKARRRR